MNASAPPLEDRFAGTLLGLALGDACGAPYEGGMLERLLWALIRLPGGGRLRWTDDTQMALVLAESLLEDGGVDGGRLLGRWARTAQWSRGYGPGTRKILARVRAGADARAAALAVFPRGSFGNGAAMRVAPLGLFYHRVPGELERAAAEASALTHAHPLGVEGGVLMARATARVLSGEFHPEAFLRELEGGCREKEFREKLAWARAALEREPGVAELRAVLGNGTAAQDSVPTALYAFCRESGDFSRMLELVLRLGGDVDTIGAMAGALFGALKGTRGLPAELLARLEDRPRIEALGRALCVRSQPRKA